MLIAKHYKETNIAEYLLYMWQVEDIIRSHNFDLDAIDGFIIQKYELDKEVKGEMRLWYQNLIDAMMKQGISEVGHLKAHDALLVELGKLHEQLINEVKDERYLEAYSKAKPNLLSLQEKSGEKNQSDISLCFNGLYGTLMLKLANKHISAETSSAMQTISSLVAYLAAFYTEWKKGELPGIKS